MAVQSSLRGAPITVGLGRDWADPALLFACVFAALTIVGERMLGDPDTHWHVAVGAWMWREGHVPWTDPFSHTFAGQPWIAKEWLSQLILFGATRMAGWAGAVAVTALALGLLAALLFAWLASRLRATLALTLTLLALILLAPHFLARPHVFALLTLLLWTRGLVAALDERRAPSPWLVLVLALWANLHGSFTFAYPLAAILGLEAVLAAPAERRLATIRDWAVFGLLALGAGCATPYGVHALLVTFTVFGSGESLPFINEWQPIGWTFVGILVGSVALAMAAALAAGGARNAVRIALLCLLTVMLIRHSRFLDVFAVVAPVVIAVPLARRFPDLAPEPRDPASRWPLLARVATGCIAAIALVATCLRSPEPDPAVTPAAALAAARAAGIEGPVYNGYNFGGFLIAQGVPTFIDGRTDQLFLGGFISHLFKVAREEQGDAFFDLMARHGVTWAIVPNDTRDTRLLEASPNWTRLHRDAVASVYVRALRGSLP